VPKNTVINVNFPACAPDEVAGVRVTRQASAIWILRSTSDATAAATRISGSDSNGCSDRRAGRRDDLWALAARYVSVTPLRLDRTDEHFPKH